METAKIAATLMMTGDQAKVSSGVEKLIECNTERKRIQSETFEICKTLIEEKYKDDDFLVLDLEDAHEGITGIVAGKIKETYNKPAVIVTPTGEDCLKGTGRSIEGVNIYDLLKENEELFQRFGGHAAACGFTMKRQNLQPLRENLNHSMKSLLEENPALFKQQLEADLVLSAEDVNLELIEELKQLEPFGCDNPQPLVQVSVVPNALRRIGNKGQYTKFNGRLDDGRELQCVIFKDASEYDEILQKNKKISIIGTLGSQSWNGRQYMQITVLGAEE